jgi:transposase-like protein
MRVRSTRKESIMGKHLDPLEKEFLIRRFKASPGVKLNDFCDSVGVSNTAFKKWIKQYDEQGIEGLARADAALGDVLPEGIDRTEENYKREILKLRIENERLKKNYTVKTLENGEQVYVPLKPKNSK